MFKIESIKTFKAFNSKSKAFVADLVKRHSSLAKIILMAGLIEKAQNPALSGKAIAAQVMDTLEIAPELGKSYKAMLAKVMVKDLAAFIAVDASDSEADIIAKAYSFAERNSLRGLYDATRKPDEQVKADKAKREAEKAQEAARIAEDMGIAKGETLPDTLDVVKLQATLKPWFEAAARGDENALAVLGALSAQITETHKQGREAQKAA